MTIPFEKLKARLLHDPRSRRSTTRLLQSSNYQPVATGLACAQVSRRPI